MDNKTITQELIKLPETIRVQERELHARKNKIINLNKEVEKFETLEMSKITGEIDGSGKKVFSNKESRDAELKRRVNSNKEVREQKLMILDAEEKNRVLEIELSFNKRMFRAFESLSRLAE